MPDMPRVALIAVLVSVASTADAQQPIHKCVENGKVVYSERPVCGQPDTAAAPKGAVREDLPPDGVNSAADIQAQFELDRAARKSAEAGSPSQELQASYSAAELQTRIARGDFPAQWPPRTERVQMGFGECLLNVQAVADAARQSGFPAESPVITGLLRVTKVWLSDGSVVFTCSSQDSALVKTVSRYKRMPRSQ